MLSAPEAARDVLRQVVPAAPAGTLVVDASTIGPAAARELAALAASHGLRYVEAPVVGSVAPAEQGMLGVLAGGSEEDYAAALPLLELWGDPARVRRIGEVGAGNALKTVVNLTLGVAMAGVEEALRLGADLGLDRPTVINALAQGPLGFSVGQKRVMLESGSYAPVAFSLELMRKDLELALAAHRELPLTAAAARVAGEAVGAGHGGDDYTALAGYLEEEE